MGSDMEKSGLFQEMSYITINEPYLELKPGMLTPLNEANMKGRQMYGGPFSKKTALDHGYFQSPFVRIFEAEAYSDGYQRREDPKKRIGKDWMPSGSTKMCGTGSDAGTFMKNRERFDPSVRPPAKAAVGADKKLRLFMTNPGKKGTGYGYVDVGIGPYPTHEHESEEYHEKRRMAERVEFEKAQQGRRPFISSHPAQPYFSQTEYLDFSSKPVEVSKRAVKTFLPASPGKSPGGMHAGTIGQFERLSEPYSVHHSTMNYTKDVVNKEGRRFLPTQGPKSTRTKSLMQAYHTKQMNRKNYKFYRMTF